MSAPSPVLKPQPSLPLGSEGCGCCDGVAQETPQNPVNRAGLSAIAYRIGDYAEFRASLHAALSSLELVKLGELRTRDEDDFTIGLIDAFACTADVLTFYQERIANESYLRTSVERVSLQELGRLIGYQLRPGVAAETWLAFALETPPKPPSTLAPDPGNFVTGVEAKIAFDAGVKVQSVPGAGEKPQIFETVEPLADARPAWNALRPWFSEPVRPGAGATFTYLDGVRNNLRVGDGLIFLGPEYLANQNPRNWDFRLIDSVQLQPEASRTLVSWKRGLTSLGPFTPGDKTTQVHVLRKRAAVFGHNAPSTFTILSTATLGRVSSAAADSALQPSGALASEFVRSGDFIDLDSLLPEVQTGGFVVLAKGAFNYASEPASSGTAIELYEVASVTEISRADLGLSAKITRLELRGQHYDQFQGFVRETSVFAVSENLQFADYPVTDAVSGERIPLAINADGLSAGRRLIVRGASARDGHAVVQQVSLVEARPISDSRFGLRVAPALSEPLTRDSVVVHANVALASHGETVAQILGAGDASASFQRFALAQLPLTYRAAANESGVKSELVVRIGDVAWDERPTLFGALPTERAFTLTTDEQGRRFVVFGDGLRGARLPSGVNNVRAKYRKGLGEDGNVTADKLTQLMTRPQGVKSVSNPLAAEGGTDPESPEAARQSIPLTARTIGRVVSLLDYEDFARAFSGIAKAQASVLQLPASLTIAITIAGPGGALLTPASPVWQNLLQALRSCGDPHVAVQLLACQFSSFQLGLRVKRDRAYETSTVLAAVQAALHAHYSFDARALSQPVQQSEVIAVAQAVPGVVAVDITALYRDTQPPEQTLPSKQVRLLAARACVLKGLAQPAELLTLDPGPLEGLEEMQ